MSLASLAAVRSGSIVPIHAVGDSYAWVVRADREAWVVDPGDPYGVLDYLDHHGVALRGILVTHYHDDHVAGVDTLREATGAVVVGPRRVGRSPPQHRVADGDTVDVLGVRFEVLGVPGHTADHLAYYAAGFAGAPLLFCGDTLFSGGCGRVIEGTAAQMLASLDRLAALPGHTQVCCAHECTLGNLRFAHAVDPDNRDVASRLYRCEALLAAGQPTLPTTIERELRINPFLRTRVPAVIAAARLFQPDAADAVSVFAALRAWKDEFRG